MNRYVTTFFFTIKGTLSIENQEIRVITNDTKKENFQGQQYADTERSKIAIGTTK